MPIKNVILAGASGDLGVPMLEALLRNNAFTVSIASRASSQAKFPSAVTIVKVPDDPTAPDAQAELQTALKGQDAVICCFRGNEPAPQIALANAAVAAGVQRFIPADFGSVDSTDDKALEYVPLYASKSEVREHLQRLAEKHTGFTWTSLVCGHFFDYGLRAGLFLIDIKKVTATLIDGGDTKWSASTLGFIADATVKALTTDAAANRMLYIQSFCTSQNEVIKMLEGIMGQTFTTTTMSADTYLREEKAKMDQGDKQAAENVVGVLGMTRSHQAAKGQINNDVLGLQEEDLETIVRYVTSEIA